MNAHDPVLSEFLESRDVVCPGCRYNLRGVKGERCPECGRGLRLDLAGRALPNTSLRLAQAAAGAFLALMLWRGGLFGYVFYREGAALALSKGAYYLVCLALAGITLWGLWRVRRADASEQPARYLDLAALLLGLLMVLEFARELRVWVS